MGLRFQRHFTHANKHPFDTCAWERRTSVVKEASGKIVFEMQNVEVPAFWSQLATDILASKYLRKTGVNGGGETSLKQAVARIVNTIRDFGGDNGYFADAESKQIFADELAYLLVHQYGAFNSPVWFNCGLYQAYGIEGQGGSWAWSKTEGKVVETTNAYEYPQSSACFINSLEDDLMSIFDLVKTEAKLFKYGSGAGTNFSTLRSNKESLSGGGTSSGLMSFLDVFDRASGAIKSGGTTRRSARMVCLDVDHPEIFDFVRWKVREEKKAHALIAAGYGSGFEEESYRTVSGQNSNNSVRLTRDFMNAVFDDGEWQTTARTDGRVIETFKARKLWQEIAESAWACADPGLQFDTTINEWHTCKTTGPIRASNPCCFTGASYVPTSDGPKTMEALETMSAAGADLPFAWSYDENVGKNVLRRIKKAWIAGKTKKVSRVETQKGLTLLCTPEHQWILTGGQSISAEKLQQGDACQTLYGINGPDRVERSSMVDLDEDTLVYDIEVEETHNFYVSDRPDGHFVNVHNSEYMFLDDTACNLASLNLTKFFNENGKDLSNKDAVARDDRFKHAVRAFITAQDILVGLSSYPTKKIAQNSHDYRPLGLGYANLGALLMQLGIAYDSTQGRKIASSITSLMSGEAYAVSAELAGEVGPFEGYQKNRESMRKVIQKHHSAAFDLARTDDWSQAAKNKHGFRNSQISVLAPTGTISFLMDCDTTGVEPDFSLIKFKKLAGGGSMVIPNRSVERALERLGYSDEERAVLLGHLEREQTLETSPILREEHKSVFDCASQCGPRGTRVIAPMGHLRMLAAVQPFLSGAVSKTINCPSNTTVNEVRELHEEAYRLGLKSVALYRDGCKASQPLTSGNKAKEPKAASVPVPEKEVTLVSRREPPTVPEPRAARASALPVVEPSGPVLAALEPLSPRSARLSRRFKLPKKRRGLTRQARVGEHKIFLRTGEYADGSLGEIFIDLHKEGAALHSVMNCFAAAVSIGLQYGVPLERFVDHFTFTRFEPQGLVEGHERIKMATSLVDYIFRSLAVDYLGRNDLAHLPSPEDTEVLSGPLSDLPPTPLAPLSAAPPSAAPSATQDYLASIGSDAPLCNACGHTTVRNGACYKCLNCGNSLGCS